VDALDVEEPLEQAPTATASPTATSDVSMVRLSRRDKGHCGADSLKVLRAIATSTTWFSHPARRYGGRTELDEYYLSRRTRRVAAYPSADQATIRLTS
jgi:hypothetical protein